MPEICINKICFEFSIYHFLFLVLFVILGNFILDLFKSKKQKLTEKLYNINYDIPDFDIYPGQHLSRSTLQSKSEDEYAELNKDYDRYEYTKPQPIKKIDSKQINKQPLQPLQPTSGKEIPNPNYKTETLQIPNGGLTDYELVTQRDLGVLANPLIPPEKRTERPQIDMTLPLLRNKYIGLPTRGSYDTYQNVGYLVNDANPDELLKLFGRQKWAGSTQYEYYAIKSTAVDQFKIPMYEQKKELYDGDSVRLNKVFPGNYKFMQFKQEELI
jgi:hypothetical protein